MTVCHVALFFKSERPDVLFWVRAVLPSIASLEEIVAAVLADKASAGLEWIAYGHTEYTVDEEYFRTDGSSKALLFLEDCHLSAFATAFGGTNSDWDPDFVSRHLYRIGTFEWGKYQPCEPHVMVRVPVTSTRIPTSLEDLASG
jgi:hypothetical protein